MVLPSLLWVSSRGERINGAKDNAWDFDDNDGATGDDGDPNWCCVVVICEEGVVVVVVVGMVVG